MKNIGLTNDEIARYSRHLFLPVIGVEGPELSGLRRKSFYPKID